jgi:hypothetical protein
MHLRAGSVKIADDSGHAGFVAHGRGEMDWLLGVIFGKAVMLLGELASGTEAY